MQAEVALARHSHAQRAVAEHFEPYPLSRRAAYVLALYGLRYGGHLVEVQLAGQHHHVGICRIEAHGLDIRYVALGGYVYLHAVAAAGGEYGEVGGYDGAYACLGCRRHDGVDFFEVFVVDYGVDRKVCLYSVAGAGGRNVAKVVEGEVGTAFGAHVESFHAEVHGVGTGVYGGAERFAAAYGSHYFKVAAFHIYIQQIISRPALASFRDMMMGFASFLLFLSFCCCGKLYHFFGCYFLSGHRGSHGSVELAGGSCGGRSGGSHGLGAELCALRSLGHGECRDDGEHYKAAYKRPCGLFKEGVGLANAHY